MTAKNFCRQAISAFAPSLGLDVGSSLIFCLIFLTRYAPTTIMTLAAKQSCTFRCQHEKRLLMPWKLQLFCVPSVLLETLFRHRICKG